MTTLPNTPSMALVGKKALVTGAGRGLGKAAAVALARAGAQVTLAARTAPEIEAVAEALRSEGHEAEAAELDVTDLAGVDHFVAGRPAFDVLVNNAGMNRPAPFLEVTVSDFDAIMALNVRAAFFVAQAVARRMMAAQIHGSIINVSSQMGLVGGERRTVYCASKFAMEGMTRAMAIDLGTYGIRVNTLCPTFVETPLTEPFLADPAFRSRVLSKIVLGRLGQVHDLMGPLIFLASDASALMTGSSLVVDGGWTAA